MLFKKLQVSIFILVAGLTLGVSWFGNSKSVQAASYSVTPLVIDEKTHDRDILKDHVTIQNKTNQRIFLYTNIDDISDSGAVIPSSNDPSVDRSDTLSSWISINRGFDLGPEEVKTLDLRIAVNLDAKPGTYHALMSFSDGATVAEAQTRKALGVTARINVVVEDSRKEQADILKFVQDKSVFVKSNAAFSYTIKNSGDLKLVPDGEISIYNRGGEEVATLPLNPDQTSIAPGETTVLHSVWANAKGVGRYKAIIRLKFGDKNPQVLTDVIFFTLFPWPLLLVLIGFIFLLFFALAFLVNRHETKNRLIQEARFAELLELSKKTKPRKRAPVKSKKVSE